MLPNVRIFCALRTELNFIFVSLILKISKHPHFVDVAMGVLMNFVRFFFGVVGRGVEEVS